MFEFDPGNVHMGLTHVGNDHTHVADGNFSHGHLFHPDEPGVQVPGTGKEYLFLQAPWPFMAMKSLMFWKLSWFSVLRADLTTGYGFPIHGCDDAHLVRGDLINMELGRK